MVMEVCLGLIVLLLESVCVPFPHLSRRYTLASSGPYLPNEAQM